MATDHFVSGMRSKQGPDFDIHTSDPSDGAEGGSGNTGATAETHCEMVIINHFE